MLIYPTNSTALILKNSELYAISIKFHTLNLPVLKVRTIPTPSQSPLLPCGH
jgi:hypothetical protein